MLHNGFIVSQTGYLPPPFSSWLRSRVLKEGASCQLYLVYLCLPSCVLSNPFQLCYQRLIVHLPCSTHPLSALPHCRRATSVTLELPIVLVLFCALALSFLCAVLYVPAAVPHTHSLSQPAAPHRTLVKSLLLFSEIPADLSYISTTPMLPVQFLAARFDFSHIAKRCSIKRVAKITNPRIHS